MVTLVADLNLETTEDIIMDGLDTNHPRHGHCKAEGHIDEHPEHGNSP
jgi:hypothetical protein